MKTPSLELSLYSALYGVPVRRLCGRDIEDEGVKSLSGMSLARLPNEGGMVKDFRLTHGRRLILLGSPALKRLWCGDES